MLHPPFIVLDFETTGLHPEGDDRITEVGLVRIIEGRIVDRFESLVNCGVRVPRHIASYTGISQQMVDAAPDAATVMRSVVEFIGESVVVSHNATFDQRFFLRECRRHRIGVVSPPFICSMRLSRRLYPALATHSLAELSRVLQLRTCGKAHRAAADAELAAELMMRLTLDLALRYPGQSVTEKLLRKLMHLPRARVAPQVSAAAAFTTSTMVVP
jgi:DNA polymerase-3 subunit epsilon